MLDRAVLLACQPLSAVALRQTRKVCTTLKGQHHLLGGQFKHTTQCTLAQRSAPAISASRTTRNFSSTWGSAKPTDFDKLTPIDREKALFHIKRKMGASYSKGQYDAALDDALELEEKVKRTMGKDNAIYASCLNNVALMNKMLGNKDEAMKNYLAALHIYEEVSGKKSPSYVSTLANLGVLYKTLAEISENEEKADLLMKAEEALQDAYNLRIEMTGNNSKESISSANQLCGLLRVAGKFEQAEKMLGETLTICRATYGNIDVLTATTLNNLGVFLKGQNRLYEAHGSYSEALDIRRTLLGDSHSDTVVTMYNLSELLLLQGSESDKAAALALQEEILKNAGNQSILSQPQSDGASVAGTESGVGTVGGVKMFTTDSPIVTAVPATLPGENLGQGSLKDFKSSGNSAVKGASEKIRESDTPQITYATRQKKKNPPNIT